MTIFIFTKKAEKKFFLLSTKIQQRIINKLKDLKEHQDIFAILKKLHHFDPATHRLRIGNYRLILELKELSKDQIKILVLDLGDRKNIYK